MCLILQETATLLAWAAVPARPCHRDGAPCCSKSLVCPVYHAVLGAGPLMGLICVSLMTDNVEHLFVSLPSTDPLCKLSAQVLVHQEKIGLFAFLTVGF